MVHMKMFINILSFFVSLNISVAQGNVHLIPTKKELVFSFGMCFCHWQLKVVKKAIALLSLIITLLFLCLFLLLLKNLKVWFLSVIIWLLIKDGFWNQCMCIVKKSENSKRMLSWNKYNCENWPRTNNQEQK